MTWILWIEIIYIVLFSGYMIASFVALIVNYRLKKKGYSGIEWKECFFPIKHLSFTIGYIVSLIPWWIMDQYVMRFYDDQCRLCILQRECKVNGVKGCGCDPYKKACSPFEKCSFDNYGPIIFNKVKAINHLLNIKYKIKVTYGADK